MKKKNSFYQNKNRNQKWTEPEVGRPIDFAEKYMKDGSSSDIYDNKRAKKNNDAGKKERQKKRRNRLIAVVLSLAVLCTGYIIADVHIIRSATAARQSILDNENEQGSMAEVDLAFSSVKIESISLDNSVMLSSVVDEVMKNGFSSVTFDAKRENGTLGYTSELVSAETFSAVSSPAEKLPASVSQLLDNDILPIARISCYRDNVVPALSADMALMNGDALYKDSDGNTYLNPDSDAAYQYLKDIVSELYSYGITVFVLDHCTLPDDISESHNDGFETLSARLSKDLDGNVRFFEEINETVSGTDPESGDVSASGIRNDIGSFAESNASQVYYITAQIETDQLTKELDNAEIPRYIIEG